MTQSVAAYNDFLKFINANSMAIKNAFVDFQNHGDLKILEEVRRREKTQHSSVDADAVAVPLVVAKIANENLEFVIEKQAYQIKMLRRGIDSRDKIIAEQGMELQRLRARNTELSRSGVYREKAWHEMSTNELQIRKLQFERKFL